MFSLQSATLCTGLVSVSQYHKFVVEKGNLGKGVACLGILSADKMAARRPVIGYS